MRTLRKERTGNPNNCTVQLRDNVVLLTYTNKSVCEEYTFPDAALAAKEFNRLTRKR